MAKAGSLLETTVKKIFDLAGFRTKGNVKIKDYEIDVLAKHEGYTIAVECKERGSGGLVIRNLIHEWAGKNKIINADKVLLAIYGVNVKTEDIKLARQNGITIWSEKDVEKFLDLAYEKKKEALTDILDSLNITTKEVIRKREELERNWKPDLERIKRIFYQYQEVKSDHIIKVFCGNETYSMVFNKFSMEEVLIKTLSEKIEIINKEAFHPVDTILFINTSIGKEELKLAEKYKIKCLVCKDIREREIKTGMFSKIREPEIDVKRTKVKIITEEELEEINTETNLNHMVVLKGNF